MDTDTLRLKLTNARNELHASLAHVEQLDVDTSTNKIRLPCSTRPATDWLRLIKLSDGTIDLRIHATLVPYSRDDASWTMRARSTEANLLKQWLEKHA